MSGEYISNPERRAIDIFHSADQGETWSVIHKIPAKTIRHIHAIEYDKYEDAYWICTGDNDNENFLFKASKDFKSFETILKYGKINRYFEMRITEKNVFLVTDSNGLETNFIRALDKKTLEVKDVQAIANTGYFTALVGKYFLSATATSPYSLKTCDALNVHIYAVNTETLESKRLAVFAVDFLTKLSYCKHVQKGLFQFAYIFFPEGDDMQANEVMLGANGVAGFSDSTWIWDLSKQLNF